MRIMGLDYGDKTVGVAISDELLITAQPIETVERERSNKLRKTYQRIEALIAEYDVQKIVIGRPLNMNGTEGERVELTEAFGNELLRRTGLEIVWVDERLTTVEADRILEETGVAHSARKEYIDKMAAAIILQSYLDTFHK
ncbi:putative holliday junction resolvase [Lachnospiraceae bacterium NE2001]|nr:putative holliday junction resolvase [Lachnospiraceae bacterium NE2001]